MSVTNLQDHKRRRLRLSLLELLRQRDSLRALQPSPVDALLEVDVHIAELVAKLQKLGGAQPC